MRPHRSSKQEGRHVADRSGNDAIVIDALLATRTTPDGVYGRWQMTALLRQGGVPGSRHGKKVRTTVPDPATKPENRSTDLLQRDSTAAAPHQWWVSDFTHCRTWAGCVFVAFVVDVYAQRIIIGWNASTTRTTDLVLTCLRWRCGSASTTATRSPPDNSSVIMAPVAGRAQPVVATPHDNGGVGW